MYVLTDKQEKFVQELLKPDTSQRDAYKAAYNTKNWKDKTIDEAACRLLKNGKVNARYTELRNKVVARAEKKAIFTVEGILQDLKELIERNKDNDDRIALEGLKTAAKTLGMLTDKIEHSGKIEMPSIKIGK